MTNESTVQPGTRKIPTSLKITAAALLGLASSLKFFEGDVRTPYYDSVGVLTVCEGITGPKVIKGKTYSDAECTKLRDDYVKNMSAKMSTCIGGTPLADHEWIAWGNFSYNVGENAFCKSTAARLLREGKKYQACEQLPKWVYAGGKDCRIKANNCRGIVARREWERATCHGENPPVPRLK